MNEEIELVPLGKPAAVADDEEAIEFVPLGKVEYEKFEGAEKDLKEITEQTTVPFYERLGTDLKLMTTSNPWEKARIIHKSFPDRTELLTDPNTHKPVLMLDGQPYSINKEGISMQDVNDFVAEAGKMLPADILSGGASFFTRLGIGALAYTGTELASQFGSYLSGGKDPEGPMINMPKVGATGLTGGGVVAVLPPVLQGAGQLIKSAYHGLRPPSSTVNTAAQNQIITPAAAGDEAGMQTALRQTQGMNQGKIPLTRGQATGNKQALETEAMMRESTGAYGQGATDVIQSADKRQMDAIEAGAEEVQGSVGLGAGFAPDTPHAIGTRLQSDIVAKEAATKATAGGLQNAARDAVKDSPAYLPGHVVKDGLDTILSVPKDRGVGALQLNSFTSAKPILTALRTFKKAFQRDRLTKADYGMVVDFRKRMNTAINSAEPNGSEWGMLVEMKRHADDMVDSAVTKGLIDGDPATIELVKGANVAWSDYKKLFFEGRKDRFGNKDVAGKRIQEILGGETPERVVSFFANVSKVAPKKETVQLINKVKDIFGADSEQVSLIKDAVIYRMFTNATRKGKADITRTDIVKNYTDFFQKNPTVAKVLFDEAETAVVRKFVSEVARTMPAEMMINPSGTGKFLARFIGDMGSGGMLAALTAKTGVPVVGNQSGAAYARSLAYGDRLTSAPWGAVSVAAKDRDEGSMPQDLAKGAGKIAYSPFENRK